MSDSSKPPGRPPALQPLTVLDRAHVAWVVPGRVWRGVGMHAPFEDVGGVAELLPQVRGHERWMIVHVESGLGFGVIRGPMTGAWKVLCQVAQAANWERPQAEVTRDEACRRVFRALRDYPRWDEVVL